MFNSGRLTAQQWHTRFSQQATWTHDLRRYLFERSGIPNPESTLLRLLEVGCGTGAILSDLPYFTNQNPCLIGLDINIEYLQLARENVPSAGLIAGNAYALPFARRTFDIVFCHYLFLWLPDPLTALQAMRQIVRPGGIVMALAEPDYGGRIDYPQSLAQVGELQQVALRRQGADSQAGRKLYGLFHRAGLVDIEGGLLGGQWSQRSTIDDMNVEWMILRNDLAGSVSEDQLANLQEIDQIARQKGERILFVPTFYAWGRVPA